MLHRRKNRSRENEEAHSVQLLYVDYMQIIFSLRASFVSLHVHVFYVLDNRWTFNFAQLSFILAQA